MPRNIEILHIVPVQDFPAGPQCHDHAELVYVQEGQYESTVEGVRFRCEAGEFCYYPPGLAHEPRHRYAHAPVLLVLQWRGGAKGAPWDEHFVARDVSSRVASALTWLWNTASRNAAERKALHVPLVQATLAEIRSLVTNEPEPQDHAQRAAAVIRHRLPYQFSMAEVAQHLGIAPGHLSRLFRQRFGMTPMQYVKQLRLEKAVNLIRSTRLPLKTIARKVGYGSGQHLSTLIRQTYGRPASAFRASHSTGI